MYIGGDGVVKDIDEGMKWLRMAADAGYADAQTALAYIYGSGTVVGVMKDSVEAAKLLLKAANQNDVYAQNTLGMVYENGEGVPKNIAEALKWYRRAAERGNATAQYNLGMSYANGNGVIKDTLEALAWLNVAAIGGDADIINDRNILESKFNQQGVLQAQKRSKEIQKLIEGKKSGVVEDESSSRNNTYSISEKPKSNGSGALVTRTGYILTAAHVVSDAARITVVTASGEKTARVIRVDEANDLAVLKIEGSSFSALPVAPSRGIKLGQNVATIGFPNVTIQGFSPKLTRGEISSLNGLGDDPRSWQISAPVQPGNSGGPLLDEYGNLIGVIVSKLGMKAAKEIGDMPQNVNYAVKSAYAAALLDSYLGDNAPEPKKAGSKKNFEEMVSEAQKAVVLILVY
jgi:TPR repeat protein/V8-like Glu-specific endopeptidase